jgi:hypothetical protein
MSVKIQSVEVVLVPKYVLNLCSVPIFLWQEYFKCPYEEKCRMDVANRRFCKRCRLKRCFEIGMRKEYILTDDEKVKKRQKIEENRYEFPYYITYMLNVCRANWLQNLSLRPGRTSQWHGRYRPFRVRMYGTGTVGDAICELISVYLSSEHQTVWAAGVTKVPMLGSWPRKDMHWKTTGRF